MASVLVLLGTGEGQTAKVVTRIEDVLTERGHDVSVVDVESTPEGAIIKEKRRQLRLGEPFGKGRVRSIGSSRHRSVRVGSPSLGRQFR